MGLLERIPQRINERPPPYYGRNDLETLLSSGDCADWIKIRYCELQLSNNKGIFVYISLRH